MERIPVWSLVVLLACSEVPAGGQPQRDGALALMRHEQRVEALRKTKGSGDPETLVTLAALIRLRTASGDLTSGEGLFDELLGVDLRRSPVLVYGRPPIEVVRSLGGLGELAEARELLEAALDRVKTVGLPEVFVLEVERALARLQVALEVPQAVARLREVEGRWRTASSAGTDAAAAVRSERPVYSAREERDPWGPSDPQFWEGDADAAKTHEHFDHMLSIVPDAALEIAERIRATLGFRDLSLITRIRRIGDSGKAPPPKPLDQMELEDIPGPHDTLGLRPHAGPLPAASLELTRIRARVHAVKRALDRTPNTDSRFAALSTHLDRLQTQRAEQLNEAWRSLDETYLPIEASAFRKRVDDGTVLLYYLVAADHTDLLVLSKGAATHHRLPVGKEQLERKIVHLRPETPRQPRGVVESSLSPEADQSAARWLFDALIAPAEGEIEAGARLLIVPDGPLHRLPFAALRRPAGEGRAAQYLIEWRPIHFAPSGGSYLALLERRPPNRQRPGGLVAFGDPDYDRSDAAGGPRSLPYAVRSAVSRGHPGRLDPLPGSRREVEQISRLFKDHKREASVLLRGNAGERAAKDARKASFLHFAVHGFADGAQPEHSFLALTLPDDGDEDGILEGWEIEDEMLLDAELVTLSACETAVGKERSGEGPASLSRAFFSAGARSVLAALWKVDDTATAKLMIAFYRHLLRGSTKDEALRQAQLELLAGTAGVSQAPYFWAAFQLSGDWR